MSNSDKTDKNLVGIITALSSAVVALTPIVKNVVEASKNKEPKDLIEIPDIYTKGFPLELKQAVDVLKSSGFIITESKLTKADADIKYRNCFDTQVVDSIPKQKKKVKPGSAICLRYITSEVIEESQRLFLISEKEQQEEKIRKADEKELSKKRRKETIIKVTANVKSKAKILRHKKEIKLIEDTKGEVENE